MVKKLLTTLVALLTIVAAAISPVRAQGQRYTSAVAATNLQVGDTLSQGFSVTLENEYQTLIVDANGYLLAFGEKFSQNFLNIHISGINVPHAPVQLTLTSNNFAMGRAEVAWHPGYVLYDSFTPSHLLLQPQWHQNLHSCH